MRRHTIVLVLLAVTLGACTHAKPVNPPCDPTYIPVYQTPPALPLPEEPDWKTCTADPADWQSYLKAMAEDLLAAWAYMAELEHIIGSYNAARTTPP